LSIIGRTQKEKRKKREDYRVLNLILFFSMRECLNLTLILELYNGVYQQSKKVEYVFKNLWFCIENSNSILFSPAIHAVEFRIVTRFYD
jgi:hypothetical protein